MIALLLVAILISACGANAAAPANPDTLNVTVSILPEKYFVERIGGSHVTVNVMVGPGDSPHTYEPKSDQMTALSHSVLYFAIGVDFENAWMDRIATANPNMQIVDVSADLEKIPMVAHNHAGETPAATNTDTGELDPHVWTSPENVKVISQSIYQALSEKDPANQAEYQANLDAFIQDIDTLESDIQTSLANISSNTFIVFHPSWGYFARDFGLDQIPIEIQGSEPSAQELAGMIDEAKAENVKVIFGQPEFSTKTADYIAQEINGQVILIDPLAEDWLDNLRGVADTFAKALNSN
jgi:zinc transport system substrate-binding protein